MVASRLAAALDPPQLMRRLGMCPDPWQETFLRSQAPQTALNCCRQSGKSSTAAVLALHTAVYDPGSLTLLLSPSQRQSGELFKKVKAGLSVLGTGAVDLRTDNMLSLEMSSGSRIVSLPGKEGTVRGFSGVRLLIVDEASRVPDALYMSIRPMLAVSGGRIVLLSTPFGQRGFYHREWTQGTGWERVEISATECPRIAPEWLAAERAAVGEWWFGQEYLCEFRETLDQAFSLDDIAHMFGPAPGAPPDEGDPFGPTNFYQEASK